jgi:hypothetical protein
MYGEHTHPTQIVKGIKRVYKGIDIYVCSGKRKMPKCWHHIKANTVHDTILDELKKIIDSPILFDELTNVRESSLSINNCGLTNQIDDLVKQLKLKDNLLVKIEDDYERGDLTALLYTKHVEKITKEISAIKIRINKIKLTLSRSDVKTESPETLKRILKNSLDNWDIKPNQSKKIVIRSFLPKIEVDKRGTFYITKCLPVSITNLI